MSRSASPSSGSQSLGRDVGDGALGEGRALGRAATTRRGGRTSSSGQPGAGEAGLGFDDRVLVVDVDAVGADREGVVGGEAQDGHVVAVPARRVEGGRIGDDPQAAERLKRGHGGPPGRRTGSA